jgi:hypothetical protein
MTEAEWLACEDPQLLLEFVRGKASDRKLRLFACACCRKIWHLQFQEGKEALEIAEKFADGKVGTERLYLAMSATYGGPGQDVQGGRPTATYAAHLACMYPWNRNYSSVDSNRVSWFASAAVYRLLFDAATFDNKQIIQRGLGAGEPMIPVEMAKVPFSRVIPDPEEVIAPERTAHSHLLRDIFGNIYRPASLDPSWGTFTVTALAQAVYDDRAFDRLPILADALEDAGCTNQDILAHCRGPGPHVLGCWVVDLLLGKS